MKGCKRKLSVGSISDKYLFHSLLPFSNNKKTTTLQTKNQQQQISSVSSSFWTSTVYHKKRFFHFNLLKDHLKAY